ncbi:hypothetical protein FRC10_008478 [Ceratobasidium sp. 414]|nr:hypothetical protein FRC10_008478 [Ceratobasidium sp. 414]
MNLRNITGLRSLPRESMQRDEFVASSIISFNLLSERMRAWSGLNDRGRLFCMKFHRVWQHEDCPVMGWYNQQRNSSTRFQSIEHRRSVEQPFFHEFLLLKLKDGATCRVERIGEGSRVDAIRYLGCTAHDVIQWFSKTDYDRFSAKYPSIPIAEVDLCQEFDILDVLAVCYSIQNTKACSVYTLQRYNCYFLCLSVLAMLTRRVASWETIVSSDNWDLCVSSSLDRLSHLSLDDSRKYLILRICSLLEPDNPRPARFIFDALQVHLTSHAGALTRYSQAMNKILWQSARNSELCQTLGFHLVPIVPSILKDESYCGSQFRHATNTSRKDSERAIKSNNTLAKHYYKAYGKQLDVVLDAFAEIFSNLWRMKEIEHPVPFGRLVASRLLGPPGSVVFVAALRYVVGESDDKCQPSDSAVSRVTMACKLKVGMLVTRATILDIFSGSDFLDDVFRRADRLAFLDHSRASSNMILDELAVNGVLSPSETSLVLANVLVNERFAWLLADLVTSDLGCALNSVQEAHQNIICRIAEPQGGLETGRVFTSTIDFQEIYLRRRINSHASRVARHQLAAAPLVCQDIEDTMTEVWKLLPSGFGGAVAPA